MSTNTLFHRLPWHRGRAVGGFFFSGEEERWAAVEAVVIDGC